MTGKHEAPRPEDELREYAAIRDDIINLLESARKAAVRTVNALMMATYWAIGRRIVEAEQRGKRRAGYGERLIERLATDLPKRFEQRFSRQNLQQMRAFYLAGPSERIRRTPSGESLGAAALRIERRGCSQSPSA